VFSNCVNYILRKYVFQTEVQSLVTTEHCKDLISDLYVFKTEVQSLLLGFEDFRKSKNDRYHTEFFKNFLFKNLV